MKKTECGKEEKGYDFECDGCRLMVKPIEVFENAKIIVTVKNVDYTYEKESRSHMVDCIADNGWRKFMKSRYKHFEKSWNIESRDL